MSKLNTYRFSLGDSARGPIGFCAKIRAPNKEKALELLKKALPEQEEIRPYTDEGVDYIEVYFNDAAITVKDIEEDDE